MKSGEANITQRTIQLGEVRLNVAEAGPAEGPPAILLHGFPEFWYGWRNQIPALADGGFRVLAPDQRGYNLSDKPRRLSAYRMDVLAGDVIRLMDALGYARVSLVGHDWGGAIAWVTAILHPERVEKLAVLNIPYPPAALQAIWSHPQQIGKSAYMFFFQLPWLPERLLSKNNWRLMSETLGHTSRPGAFSQADLVSYRRAWAQPGALTGMLNWYRAFFRRPVRLPLKPRLKMPVLMLWGAQDVALDRSLAEASIRLCANGQLVFFENASHWIQHEETAAVNQRLSEFLAAPGAGSE